MPRKSRRRRGKRSSQIKKAKTRQSPPTIVAQESEVAQTFEPVSLPEQVAPSVGESTSVPVSAARYPFIFAELRRIGILAGMMLVILVVLALVLS